MNDELKIITNDQWKMMYNKWIYSIIQNTAWYAVNSTSDKSYSKYWQSNFWYEIQGIEFVAFDEREHTSFCSLYKCVNITCVYKYMYIQ